MQELPQRGHLDVRGRGEDELLELFLVMIRAPKLLNFNDFFHVSLVRLQSSSLKKYFSKELFPSKTLQLLYRSYNYKDRETNTQIQNLSKLISFL